MGNDLYLCNIKGKARFCYRDLYSLVSLYVSLAFMLSLMIISFVFMSTIGDWALLIWLAL